MVVSRVPSDRATVVEVAVPDEPLLALELAEALDVVGWAGAAGAGVLVAADVSLDPVLEVVEGVAVELPDAWVVEEE